MPQYTVTKKRLKTEIARVFGPKGILQEYPTEEDYSQLCGVMAPKRRKLCVEAETKDEARIGLLYVLERLPTRIG